MKVLALPRDPNPYQQLLYEACARRGVQVAYLGELTPSHTLNVLLLPLELLVRRVAGWRLLHLHWVFGFRLPGARRLPVLRRVAAWWFRIVLRAAHALDVRLVWTAHNVLPHEPVFHDEVALRRALVHASDLVIAHSAAAERELERVVGRPRAAAVIPMGPYEVPARTPATDDGGPLAILFFGKVLPYKGVEDLLVAAERLVGEVDLRVTVAGECPDAGLRRLLEALAERRPERVVLRLEHVADAELPALFGAHDALVLPFRRVASSSTVMLGLRAAIPVVVPDLPVFEELPVRRWAAGPDGLVDALRELAAADREALRREGEAGRAWTAGCRSWDDAARATREAFDEVLAR